MEWQNTSIDLSNKGDYLNLLMGAIQMMTLTGNYKALLFKQMRYVTDLVINHYQFLAIYFEWDYIKT